MCLDRVDPKPRRKFGIGYKFVGKLEDGTYTCRDYTPCAGTVKYPLNQWITDPNDGDVYTWPEDTPTYRTGFHIMLDKKVSLSPSTVTIKVRFRKVTTTQVDKPDIMYGPQVVARELMNLGEVSQ